MVNDYFILDGNVYHTGTIVVVSNCGREAEATFIGCHNQLGRYILRINGSKWFLTEEQFKNRIIRITDKIDPSVRHPVVKQKKEPEIDGLLEGWLWYIVLMAVSIVFKDAIGLWIFISVVFFSWRNKKIKEEGTYIEW